ncbi:MAG TPA: alanine--tRNA ligase, partial [Solirubrobacteraceae bacterium]|nr:alanine--tRNA ligase [Solirubrobacteraceae bacterium]
MTSDEIRKTFLDFFVARDHLRLPSAPLIPAQFDPSALFTIAGMHPLKSYFLGIEPPPHPRVTTCQKTFRTVDIEIIGTTSRHLTFFEMLGNFSFGDYFKREATRYAWELSVDGFGFDPENIWISVFGGDEELGIGPDEEAIEAWLEIGVPRERIVELPRSENFWQMGPTGPCGPCSELYLDRGVEFGKPDDLPGGENERFLEYWNLVFTQYDLRPDGSLSPLPKNNIDTGLGLNRLAAVLQGKPSVFETDQFAPLISLAEELSGRHYARDYPTDRAMRILADHSRATTFLIADGVVPSNEDRGYVLRRIMRRAIQQGRSLELDQGFLGRFADVVVELMGSEYPELHEQQENIHRWISSEEQSFGRTLEQGSRLLDEILERVRETGAEGISSADAFLLHDTYGFPIDLTRELAAEHGLGVDEEGFEELMGRQRERARASSSQTRAGDALREDALALAGKAGFRTDFVGYETTDSDTTIGAALPENGRVLVKLVESPFYATGGGQIADSGYLESIDGDSVARVDDVLRIGEDQVLALVPERGTIEAGERVRAHVDRAARHATEANHTATHLLHAALRRRLGNHVRQAGSYVGPDKLRFDFSHGQALTEDELSDVEDQVNAWILANDPVCPITTTLEEARKLGAMALFGEKYGEVVRMVQIGDGRYSRELCGGTHVRSTAEIGVFHVLSETSSAANVRRIEAITGPAAVHLLRERDRLLGRAAETLRVQPEQVPQTVSAREQERRQLQKATREGGGSSQEGAQVEALLAAAEQIDGAKVLAAAVQAADAKALLGMLDRVKARLPETAIVLGSAAEGRVHLIASVPPPLVQRGVKAGAIVKAAAGVAGGGGGGR